MALVKRDNQTKVAKKSKPTKMQVKSLEMQYIGTEPTDISIKGYTSALNWYNYERSDDDAFEYLINYMTKSIEYTKQDITYVKAAPKYTVPTTVGWIARMLSNGNKLDNTTYFKTKISEAIQAGIDIKQETANGKKSVNVQERVRAKADTIITDIEEALDRDLLTFDIYTFLTGREAKTNVAGPIKAYYQRFYDEVLSDDPQVKEAFGRTLKTNQNFWQKFMDDLDRFVGNVKATKVRKPRAKKTIQKTDLVKGLKYQKDFPDLKIVSVNPSDIIGAQQLWTFHTKYNTLTKFEAEGTNGLAVKGTTLYGFNPESSICKKARKPADAISGMLGASKIGLRKYMDTLKTTATVPTGRINADTILLRVVR